MDKIDAGYLYELGHTIRSIRGVGQGAMAHPWQAWGHCVSVRDAANNFTEYSIFSSGLRTCRIYGRRFVADLTALIVRMEDNEWPNQQDVFGPFDLANVMRSFSAFETVMIAELQSLPIFLVPPRGAFDNNSLIEAGHRLFPASLLEKAPETELDVVQAGKCIAFDLPTAGGFHLHRANEAVLRRYFDCVMGAGMRPTLSTMGTLLGEMKKQKAGDANIIAALDAIKTFHRNPLMHPEHTLRDIDEAISLYSAIRSAVGYMLEVLPDANASTTAVPSAPVAAPPSSPTQTTLTD